MMTVPNQRGECLYVRHTSTNLKIFQQLCNSQREQTRPRFSGVKMKSTLVLVWLCLLGTAAGSIIEEDFSIHKREDPNDRFDYSTGIYGPDYWGSLRPDWHLCGDGLNQSPMAMEPGMMVWDPSMGILKAEYKTANATIINIGRTVQVWWHGAGSLVIGNTTYYLKDIDFHTPSEHTLGLFNDRYPLEMHMVHRTKNRKKVAVISILYAFGEEDRFLAQIFNHLPPLSAKYQKIPLGPLSSRFLTIPLGQHYGRYYGSETMPPCDENVLWTVVHVEGHTVSTEQLLKLKKVISGDNARPLQRGNGRKFHFL